MIPARNERKAMQNQEESGRRSTFLCAMSSRVYQMTRIRRVIESFSLVDEPFPRYVAKCLAAEIDCSAGGGAKNEPGRGGLLASCLFALCVDLTFEFKSSVSLHLLQHRAASTSHRVSERREGSFLLLTCTLSLMSCTSSNRREPPQIPTCNCFTTNSSSS